MHPSFALFRHITPISSSCRNSIHITSHQELTSWSSREKGTAEGCSLKIPDCFSPGLEWLITQAAKQEVLSVGSSHSTVTRKLRQRITYSATVVLGPRQRQQRDTTVLEHTYTHVGIWGNDVCRLRGDICFQYKSQVSAICRCVYPSFASHDSLVQRRGDSLTRPSPQILRRHRDNSPPLDPHLGLIWWPLCHELVVKPVLTCHQLSHYLWMQPGEVWGRCWRG